MTAVIGAGDAADASTVFDAIVVGAGAAGCFAALELTTAGMKVLLLDAGPQVNASDHFPTPRPRDFGMPERAWLALTGQPVQARCFACTRATRQLYVNDRENPYSRAPGRPFNWFRGRQVGGRLHTWGRVAPRFSDFELKPSAHGGEGLDWPIAYEDLEPSYARVERFLGVHGTPEGLPQRPDGAFVAPRRLSAAEERVRDVVQGRWPARRLVAAPVVAHNPQRIPLPLIAALQTGHLTLRSDAVVKRVQVDATGSRARGVEFIDRVTRRAEVVQGRIIVLCASAFESVRILLNSAGGHHPHGLGNSSGTLGRYVMDHCMTAMSGDVPQSLAGAGHTAEDVERDPYDLASAYVYVPGFKNITEPPRSSYQGSFSMLGSIGRHGRGFFLAGFGDMLPSASNTITIDASRRDAWGIPVAHIDCVHSANDRTLVADMTTTMHEIAAAAGLRIRASLSDMTSLRRRAIYASLWRHVVTPFGAFHPGGAIHEMGGARMGDDSRTSVLNRYNQSWDVPNLFVTDGACFPSSGHQSHTLSIMALTVRTCDFIVSESRAGRL